MPGKLFIVGTPIGNMEDITLRALRALREADIIAAEDTRRTAQLLARHGISRSHRGDAENAESSSTPSAPLRCNSSEVGRAGPARRLVSYHEFNEAKRTQELLKELQQGRTVALVTDAGMPTISDPGQRLIKAILDFNAASPHLNPLPQKRERRLSAAKASVPLDRAVDVSAHKLPLPLEGEGQGEGSLPITLEIIPGPSAVTMAVAASGISSAGVSPVSPSGAFLFFGFLPHKSTQRRKALTLLAPLPCALVFFESPYRLVKSLRDMLQILGNRQTVIARELTKKFEEIIRGDLATILKKLENRSIKGEITVVVEGKKE